MHSLWNDSEANACQTDLERRVYSSRLLGRDPSLVLHGGGNTSVKLRETDLVGEAVELLYVKGSGWDLGTIEAPGFAPVRMDRLLKLARLETLSDTAMANELRAATVRADAPAPSVEAILHAVLPHKFVDHTHSDALISISNTPDGEARLREVYGDDAVYIPYVMPGFALARLCAELFPKNASARTVGLVLFNHGLFSFGADARESYERMIELADRAERYLQKAGAWEGGFSGADTAPKPLRETLPSFRRQLSAVAGRPMLLAAHQDPASLGFARDPAAARLATGGPATPDHVLRTKRVACVGRDLAAYAAAYRAYFEANAGRSGALLKMLDAAPRVVVDPEWGVVTAGANAKDLGIVADIYGHTIEIIGRAEKLGGWRALPPHHIFDVEYWDLEQAKLRAGPAAKMFEGEVVLVTGGSSGIGKACVEEFAARGAAVVALDINPAVLEFNGRAGMLGVVASVTDRAAVAAGLEETVRTFGGLDMIVLNAGTFPKSRPIAELEDDLWSKTFGLNLDANLSLLRETYPLLKEAPRGGRVLINGSKNVPAPGPGQAAYSASKAALTQLARVAALEWGDAGIRVNVVHPNAVFDTGLWTEEVLAQRAKSYGITIDEYKRNNVLRVEITSRDVARVAAELCGPNFAKITGAQVAVDGGNDRVI